MNDFQILTKADLDGLQLSQSVKDIILEGVNLEQTSIVDIFNLINNLEQLITTVMQTSDNQRAYRYSFKEMRKNTFKQVMMVGGMVIFKLRQFLLQESIIFSLGATDEYGSLYERQITQDELFQKIGNGQRMAMRSSLSSHALMLSRSLETFNQNTASNFTQVGQLNLWPKILKLAFEGPAIKGQGNDETDSRPSYYQKDSLDKNVYIRYSEGKRQLRLHYYGKKEKQFFNRGWLYEWYMEYIAQSPEHEQMLLNSLQKGSLAPLFYGKSMESIEGYRGGDYSTAQGQQVQAKYQNQQIITFTSILTVIQQIKSALALWMGNQDTNALSQEFVNLFTSNDASLNKLNKDYNTIIENQLLSLLRFTT